MNYHLFFYVRVGDLSLRYRFLNSLQGDMYLYDESVFMTGNMIQSLCWNDSANMLAALADGKFTVWYYPNTIYVDRDLASRTVFEKEAR